MRAEHTRGDRPTPDAAERHRELATAVHELRTPLATVRGFIETLLARRDDLSDDTQQHILEIARRNAVLLGQRIDTMLEHERFATGHVRLDPLVVPLEQSVEEIVEDCAGLLGQHDVDVDVAPDVRVHADTIALAHVLGNLLSNAARHSPAASTITVRSRQRGEEVEVAVADHGRGIDARDLPRVFDPFYRSDDGPSGMGLGLSVVQRYVELWGGSVDITSSPGEGTTVTFTMPPAPAGDEVVAIELVEPVAGRTSPAT